MSGPRQSKRKLTAAYVAFLIAGMVCSFAYLAYGPGFSSEYAGFGALFFFPFCVGALITLSSGEYSPFGCLVAPIALALICLILIKLGMEGLICVAMILPFWLAFGLGGGLTIIFLRRRDKGETDETSTRLKAIGIAVVPFVFIYLDGMFPPKWQQYSVERSVTIDASADVVWPKLLSIPDIDPAEGIENPTHDWFDVPRPSQATLTSSDDELVRKARWGEDLRFEEIITGIDANHSLQWQFAFPDDSVQRHTDRHISPDGEMLKIGEGRYDLHELPNGKLSLSLTTTYRMRTRMDWYFRLWGERLLGDVQENVLAIVKQRSEQS